MDGLRVDFGDGVSAVDRTSRAIVLLTAQALQHLAEMGYRRERHSGIEVHEDGMPVWVTLNGKRAFEIDFVIEGDEGASKTMGLTVMGHWLFSPRRRFFLVRWASRLLGWIRRKDA